MESSARVRTRPSRPIGRVVGPSDAPPSDPAGSAGSSPMGSELAAERCGGVIPAKRGYNTRRSAEPRNEKALRPRSRWSQCLLVFPWLVRFDYKAPHGWCWRRRVSIVTCLTCGHAVDSGRAQPAAIPCHNKPLERQQTKSSSASEHDPSGKSVL